MQLTRRLDSNHDMTFGRGLANFARDAESTAQNVRTRLLLINEEWFMDTDSGLPYLQRITQKPADLAYAEAVIKKKILETDGVNSITSFNLSFDHETRKLTVTASVNTVYNTIADIKVRL